ncbi:MAG: hypothetical protein WB947_01410 [Thermoplasmata archaeon]
MTGIPPGMVDEVIAVLRGSSGPVRRRPLLEELERRGHRISLAGLNRTLEQCRAAGLTMEGPDGVRLNPTPGVRSSGNTGHLSYL